ncbi:AraC family transcriptional regulator [Maribacter polysiphoniae]|uniref:AraC family transcriptional regulator n=1 Tax=Maribacter polysiphoniae TaxID=429344 RepID=A0A316DZX6_9FLAO|nr:helix-turn-helix domain-containing protein [Maribacter polysiphoniae]MBD1261528.1 AraC family transcriptional regulator [Maribacter polysiphoniae]PWK22862.1 helix-turn-helix protein [Maribacter polysiphoniae]
MKFLQILFIVNIIFGFALGLTILFKPFLKSNTNKYLGYAVLIVSFIMLNIVLKETGFYDEYDLLYILYDIEWIFLFPVFIFFFVLKSIGHELTTYKELQLLYVPFIISVLVNLINNLERDFGLFTFNSEILLRMKTSFFSIENSFVYMYNVFLMVWLFFILKRYNEKKDGGWLWRLWGIISALIVLWIVLDFTENIILSNVITMFSAILLIGLSFFLYWISYTTIYRQKLRTEAHEINTILQTQDRDFSNTKNTTPINAHFENFENLFKKEHVYRNPNITRESIAERLNISAGYLSQLISSHLDDNFSNYVNQYRVDEVKKMLCDDAFNKYNIESIGLEAGFSSKTTFFKVFKKNTGMTPYLFKKRNK